MERTESEFDEEMRCLYRRAGKKEGYWANRFLAGVKKHGGTQYAKQLLAKAPGEGFNRLIENHPDLTVENLVLDPRFRILFTKGERDEARNRLGQ